MATRKLTKRAVDTLPIRDRVYIAYDNALPGFGCRVTPNGARSWIVEYRPHGGGRSVGKRRITLGSVSVLTPEQAREAAGDVLARVRFGEDAPHDRATRRSSPSIRRSRQSSRSTASRASARTATGRSRPRSFSSD